MCIIVCLIWLVTWCLVKMVFWFSKEFSAACGIRRLKTGLRAAKTNLSPYVQNIYRIEVKYIFLGIVHQGLSWEFFSDFSVFRYCTPGWKLVTLTLNTSMLDYYVSLYNPILLRIWILLCLYSFTHIGHVNLTHPSLPMSAPGTSDLLLNSLELKRTLRKWSHDKEEVIEVKW